MHGLHHAILLCPWLSSACSNPCPLSQWYHPIISSSVAPFPYPRSFPASRSFLMGWLFASGGQSFGASVFSISPSNEYSGLISFRIDWLDLLAVWMYPNKWILCQIAFPHTGYRKEHSLLRQVNQDKETLCDSVELLHCFQTWFLSCKLGIRVIYTSEGYNDFF